MSLPREPLFLARQNYRRRRIADAARVLPVLGGVLFLLPLLAAGVGRNDTVGWLVYVFCIWLLLIVVSAVLARGVSGGAQDAATLPDGNAVPANGHGVRDEPRDEQRNVPQDERS